MLPQDGVGVSGFGYESRICDTLDNAILIYKHPNATFSQRAAASFYMSSWAVSHSAAIVGTSIAGYQKVGAIANWGYAHLAARPALAKVVGGGTIVASTVDDAAMLYGAATGDPQALQDAIVAQQLGAADGRWPIGDLIGGATFVSRRFRNSANIPDTCSDVPYENVYRFATQATPETLQPNLSRANRLIQIRVNFLMRFPIYREWRAHNHMRGDTRNSPFISVLLDPQAGANSTDPWLRTIITGNPGVPGVKRAPDLGTFRVPQDTLIGPRPDNLLSIQETEMVFWGDDLANYLSNWQTNPY